MRGNVKKGQGKKSGGKDRIDSEHVVDDEKGSEQK